MEERGENPTSLARAMGGGDSNRDLIRQIRLRHEEKPGAVANGKTLDKIAKFFDVSIPWLLNGGLARGSYAPIADELTAAALTVGVRREIIERVLAEYADADDPFTLVQVMVGLETVARAGGGPKPRKKAR